MKHASNFWKFQVFETKNIFFHSRYTWVIQPPVWPTNSLKTTPRKFNITPKNRLAPKRKLIWTNHHFSGAMLNFGGVTAKKHLKIHPVRVDEMSTPSELLGFQGGKTWVCFFLWYHPPKFNIHPGRLTWNLQITHLERKMIFQTSMIMFHVDLPGCSPWRMMVGRGSFPFGSKPIFRGYLFNFRGVIPKIRANFVWNQMVSWLLVNFWWLNLNHLSNEKTPLTFHYTGCLMRIFVMVYHNPDITRQYNPLYTLNN